MTDAHRTCARCGARILVAEAAPSPSRNPFLGTGLDLVDASDLRPLAAEEQARNPVGIMAQVEMPLDYLDEAPTPAELAAWGASS